MRKITSLCEFFGKIRPTKLSQGIRDYKAYVAFTIFGATYFLRFHCFLFILRAVHVGFVDGSYILITYFEVVVFASEILHAVVVDFVEYGEESGSNTIPALVAYVI